jgi:septal ring factor EnvC (AmiA/AmiB activator)
MTRSVSQRRSLGLLLVVTLLLVGLPGVHSWALPPGVPNSQRELDAVQQRAAELARLVSEAEEQLAEVEARLDQLARELSIAEVALEQAVDAHARAAVAATEASDRARAAEADLDVALLELAATIELLDELARDTYKYGRPAASTAMAVFESYTASDDSTDLVDRLHYLQRGVGVRATAVERAGVLKVEVEHLTRRAQHEEDEHQRWLLEADEARVEAATLHADVAALTDETSAQLDRSAQLVAVLADEQDDVEARIGALEAQVAQERLEQERRAQLERERQAREARELAAQQERARAETERQAQAATASATARAVPAPSQPVVAAPAPNPSPSPSPSPTPTATAPTPSPSPTPAPAPQPPPAEPDPTPESAPTPTPAPRPSPAPAPAPEPRPEPKPEPKPEPAPAPKPTPAPAPKPEPKPEPAPAPKPAPAPAPAPAPTPIQPGPTPALATVGGITVAASLAPQLQALLDHARSDGIVLGGSGYRSPEIQARLRLANGCPDIYQSPASACRIPTAPPGGSEHEKGLAVDFTYQGQTICFPLRSSSCVGNAAFDWLQRNAGSYGLYNLPSEAWHWSTTGR